MRAPEKLQGMAPENGMPARPQINFTEKFEKEYASTWQSIANRCGMQGRL